MSEHDDTYDAMTDDELNELLDDMGDLDDCDEMFDIGDETL